MFIALKSNLKEIATSLPIKPQHRRILFVIPGGYDFLIGVSLGLAERQLVPPPNTVVIRVDHKAHRGVVCACAPIR
jgi:hypothetical protein